MATTIHLGEIPIEVSLKKIENFSSQTDLLSDNEMKIYGSLRLEKRKKEFLAGRIAAKEAVGVVIDQLGFHRSAPRIEVLKSPGGAPFVTIEGDGRPSILVSISHSNELAAAAACIGDTIGLGIDVEISEKRSNSFLQTAFTSEERTCIERVPKRMKYVYSTHLFTLKEAISKALGTGLSVNTYDIEVLYEANNTMWKDGGYEGCLFTSKVRNAWIDLTEEGGWKVLVHNKAKERFELVGGSRILVRSRDLSNDLFVEADGMELEKRYAIGLAAIVRG